jgi:hypothetical protein
MPPYDGATIAPVLAAGVFTANERTPDV